MSEELRISAYGYTSSKNGINLDNLFVDGRTVADHREPQVKISKVSTGEIQVYAVSDAGALATSPESALKNSEEFFSDLGDMTEGLESEGKVEREPIWEFICDSTDKIQARAYRNDEDIQGLSFASLFFQGNRGLAVHAGDARIYVIRNNRILKITEDHLKVTELLKHKVITNEQLDIRKKDSELTAYVGMDDVGEYKDRFFSKFFVFYPDDMFLICTDGLSDVLRAADLERFFRSAKNAEPAEIMQSLAERAEDLNDEDFSLIFLKIENTVGEAPARGSATIPQAGSFKTEKAPEKKEEASEEKAPARSTDEASRAAARKAVEADDDDDDDDDDDEEGFSLAGIWASVCGFFSGLFKRRDDDDDDDEDGDDDDDDEEESLLSRLMGRLREEPKLAAIAAGVLVMLVLLIILMVSACRHDAQESKPETESQVQSQIESEPESEPESQTESEPESKLESEPESEIESEPESEIESEPESEPESTVDPADEPRSYTVQYGEGWGLVASGMYPEYADNWNIRKSIYEYLQTYNNTTSLKAGTVLNGPSLNELKQLLGLE